MCVDPLANNYNSYADFESDNYVGDEELASYGWVIDNSSCNYSLGCTNPSAYNYDSSASVDDGSCIDESNVIIGCTDENYLEYDGC